MPDGDRPHNYRVRLMEVMSHTSRYAFEGKARLARDTGLGRMTIIRLLSGRHEPSYYVVQAVVGALEAALGRSLDVRDVITYSGGFERSACDICGCSGCLPDGALREDGAIDRAYGEVPPGTWKEFLPLSGDPTMPDWVGTERTLYRKEGAAGRGELPTVPRHVA